MIDWAIIALRVVGGLAVAVVLFVLVLSGRPDHSERICVSLNTGDHLWIRDNGADRWPRWAGERYGLESQAPGPCPALRGERAREAR